MLFDESVLTLSEAARALPLVGGKRVDASAIWRWGRKGVRGVRLELRQIGGRLVTTHEALERFTRELAEVPPPARPTPPPAITGRSTARREVAIAAAEAVLDAAGIGGGK